MNFSIKESAKKMNVAEVTLRRIISRGAIGYHKIGKLYRLTEDDISAYLNSVRNTPEGNHIEIVASGNIYLKEEIIKMIERETFNLRHGIVNFSLHIVDSKPVRYTVSREQSLLWNEKDDQSVDHNG